MDGSQILAKANPLHEAQHAYDAAQRERGNAQNFEIESDLSSFELMGSTIGLCVSRCWKLYRVTNDEADQREFTTADVCGLVADAIAEAFSMSREAALVLAEHCKAGLN